MDSCITRDVHVVLAKPFPLPHRDIEAPVGVWADARERRRWSHDLVECEVRELIKLLLVQSEQDFVWRGMIDKVERHEDIAGKHMALEYDDPCRRVVIQIDENAVYMANLVTVARADGRTDLNDHLPLQ